MNINEQELQTLIDTANQHDEDYLYYLLGSSVTPGFQTQAAGKVQKAGKNFFDNFKTEIRGIICGKNGPYESLKGGIVTKKDVPKLVAIAIMTGVPTLGAVTVTYAIATYLALLIVNAGLGAYCHDEKRG